MDRTSYAPRLSGDVRAMANDRMTPRQFLASELRRAREAKGMKPTDVAKAVLVSEGLVRAWEKGRRIPQHDDLVRFEEQLGTGGLLTRMREELVKNEPAPEWMGRWIEIEDQATQILWYQPLLIPGLLQTADYAREVITSSGRQIDDAEEQIQARLERQKILSAENSLVFVAIMDEGVLYRSIGDAKTMHEQLSRVLEITKQPNVFVHIVPLSSGAYPGLAGGFGIASMDGQEFAYVDDAFSGDVLEHAEDVAVMKRVWETLRAEALPVKQSMELVAKAVEKWTT